MTDLNDDQKQIADECDAVKAMLLDKNKNYGNSALDPVRVFSKADTVEQILVRLDDKLSRLKRGAEAGEDITLDIIGYLVLLRIAKRRGVTPKSQPSKVFDPDGSVTKASMSDIINSRGERIDRLVKGVEEIQNSHDRGTVQEICKRLLKEIYK